MLRMNLATVAAVAITTLAGAAHAQNYPDRMIELIIPVPPASSADLLGRVIAEGIGSVLGQRIVVLNKPGAGGMIGTAEASRAKPDGYTLLHTAVYAMTVQPLTERQVPYTHQSFEPICQTFKNDMVVVARPDTYKSIKDLLTASKAKQGGLDYGTPGLGTIPYLAMAELQQLTKVEFNHVPFRGPPQTIQMTAGGQIDFAVSPLTAAASSDLFMPAIFSSTRNPSIPNVPTAIEQGFNVAPLSIGGLFAPAGIPADVRDKLDKACAETLKSEAFQRIAKRTLQPPDFMADAKGFRANIAKDVEEKRRLLTALGMAK